MKLGKLIHIVDGIAPFALAESWDNVGLQIGDPGAVVTSVMTALEVTPEVITEAVDREASVIVAHHPLIFSPPRSIDYSRPVDSMVASLIRFGIGLVVAHTNYDSIADGTNGEIADRLGLGPRRFLKPAAAPDSNVKFAVFVPLDHINAIIDAIASAGAGVIGDYSHCTFRTPGTGTYKPLDGANPYAGKVGEVEHAEEVRLECVCPRGKLSRLIESVRAAHPYEEMAFDVFPLIDAGAPRFGLGLVGEMEEEARLEDFARICGELFASTRIGLVGETGRPIRKVAVCSGAGGEAVRLLRSGSVDVLVTGEMNHHQCAELRDKGIAAVLVGHFESEAVAMPRLARQIADAARGEGIELRAFHSEKERSPVVGA